MNKPPLLPRRPTVPSLTQQAYQLARSALTSASSYTSTSTCDSDLVPDFVRFQQQQARTTTSPYHAPAFTLTATTGVTNHPHGTTSTTTTRRPQPYGSGLEPRSTIPSIDPRLTINPPTALTTTAATTTTTKTTAEPYTEPGPADYGDLSSQQRHIVGGCISAACPPSELDTVIKNSHMSPSPDQYNVSKLTRNGGTPSYQSYTFSSGPARSLKTTIKKRSTAHSPYTCSPGPGHYSVNNNNVSRRNQKIGGIPGDRFTMKGDALLENDESSYRDIQYENLDVPMEWRLRTGHCIDVAERNTNMNAGTGGTATHVDATSYRTEIDGAVGRSGRLGRSERKSTVNVSFHRPNQLKAAARRPLHVGIFERLAKNATDRLATVESCANALKRVELKGTRKKTKRQRRVRSRMTQRNGTVRMVHQ